MQNSVIQQHRVLQSFMVIAMFCAGKLYFMVIDYIKKFSKFKVSLKQNRSLLCTRLQFANYMKNSTSSRGRCWLLYCQDFHLNTGTLKLVSSIWWRPTATERINEKNTLNACLSMCTCTHKQSGFPEHESAETWLGIPSRAFWQTWASSLTAQQIVGCHQWQGPHQPASLLMVLQVASLCCRDSITQLKA